MKKKSARMPFATAAVIAFAGTVLGIAQVAHAGESNAREHERSAESELSQE